MVLSEDLKMNSSSFGGLERKGVRDRRNSFYKSMGVGEFRVMGIYS